MEEVPEDEDGIEMGVERPGAAPFSCAHAGSGDGEGSEPTFALLALGGLALLARRRRRD